MNSAVFDCNSCINKLLLINKNLNGNVFFLNPEQWRGAYFIDAFGQDANRHSLESTIELFSGRILPENTQVPILA